MTASCTGSGMPSIRIAGSRGHAALVVQHQGDGDEPGKGQRAAVARAAPRLPPPAPCRRDGCGRTALRRSSRRGPAPGAASGRSAMHHRLRHLQRAGEPRMLGHVAQLAMHRHGDLRPGPAIHLRQFVARRMAGDMDEMILARSALRRRAPPACSAARRSASSLPGMMREEKITASPLPRWTLG